MNVINLICGNYISLELYSYFLLCMTSTICTLSKGYLCLSCLPDGLVKFLHKGTQCCVGWVVQSVFPSKRNAISSVQGLNIRHSDFQRAQGTQMETLLCQTRGEAEISPAILGLALFSHSLEAWRRWIACFPFPYLGEILSAAVQLAFGEWYLKRMKDERL